MQTIITPAAMRRKAAGLKSQGATLGLVPTMGYLHPGHLALVRQARKECDIVAVSIFVNPAQFSPSEDFERYPRDIQRDQALLQEAGADWLFCPKAADIYPPGYKTYVEVAGLQDKLCGAFRPGHFKGVCTIVLKLFNLVLPDRAYFGTKDAQQLRIIEQMTADLNLGIKIVPVLTVREPDGLALSSRNVFLTTPERAAAPLLFQALQTARLAITRGERSAANLKALMLRTLQQSELIRLQYLALVSYDTLEAVETLQGKSLIALAAFLGATRLIDNIILEIKD